MAWHADFVVEAKPPRGRDKQLAQLEMLSRAGLLSKTPVTVRIGDTVQEATRYRLTGRGWAATAYKVDGSCLTFGVPRFLGITEFQPKAASARAGLEMYTVKARSGLASDADLEPWARDPEFQSVFPGIEQALKGQEWTWQLIRGAGEWVDYYQFLRDGMDGLPRPESPPTLVEEAGRAKRVAEYKALEEEMRTLPTPSMETIKANLLKGRALYERNCLSLPGGDYSYQPVDRNLETLKPARYAVAVFTNKERRANDRIQVKTLPVLAELERIGILRKHPEQGIRGTERDSDLVFDADVYELTPAYAKRISPENPDCLPLGEPVREFVEFRMVEKDSRRYPNLMIRYKALVKYPNAPAWMKDPALKAVWPELRGVMEDGMACQGTFVYSKKKQEAEVHNGDCYWAFDSNQTPE
jgi:hypothetical protein